MWAENKWTKLKPTSVDSCFPAKQKREKMSEEMTCTTIKAGGWLSEEKYFRYFECQQIVQHFCLLQLFILQKYMHNMFIDITQRLRCKQVNQSTVAVFIPTLCSFGRRVTIRLWCQLQRQVCSFALGRLKVIVYVRPKFSSRLVTCAGSENWTKILKN